MNPQRLLQHFETISEAPDAVAKLRRFVVELAVQGRLSDSAVQEQSSSDLLRRISVARARMVKEGVISKAELPAAIEEHELPMPRGSGACFVRLSSIAVLQKGPTGIRSAEPGEFPLEVTAEGRLTCDHFDFDGAAAIVPLVSSTGHGHASLNRLHYQEGKFALGNILCAVVPILPDAMSARFIYEYLTAFKEELLVARMIGTANVSLSVREVGGVPIPVIPTSAQQRVDELMTLCDQMQAARDVREQQRDRLVAASLHRLTASKSDDTLDSSAAAVCRADHAHFQMQNLSRCSTRHEHIKQLRACFLNLATRGLLVSRQADDEDVGELLALSDQERERVAKTDRRADTAQQILLAGDKRWDVPPSWAWRGLGDLVLFIDYRGKTPTKTDSGVRLITAKNVKKGFVNLHPEEFVSDASYIGWMTRGLPQVDDVLFTTEAPMGNAAVVMQSERFALAQRVINFRSYGALIPDFLVLQLLSEPFQAALDSEATGLTAKGIKAAKLKRLPVAIPPLAEQHRIVAKVDELMTLCDQLEASLASAQIDRTHLLDALLHEALATAGTQVPSFGTGDALQEAAAA